MRGLVIIATAIALTACSGSAKLPRATDPGPYGLWTTERGQTIQITRDGRYKFCEGTDCAYGSHTPEGSCALLLGFADMPQTEKLRTASGWEEGRKALSGVMDETRQRAIDVCDYGMSKKLKHDLCQGRPCRGLGNFDGDTHRLVKIQDY